MSTMAEALMHGEGIERPFRCEQHNDTQASASVNVLKGVWYCHACHESGSAKDDKAPKVEDLQAMLEPEKVARTYADAFLELYAEPVYWADRFEPWVCFDKQLGQDPFTGDATFPVHTAGGILAGVGRRRVVTEVVGEAQHEVKGTRYLYPRHWSAAATLFGSHGRWRAHDVLMLVEGAADATAGWEVGIPTFAVYGSGVHLPQIELVARMSPKLILLGFDMDEAGERAVTSAFKSLYRLAVLERVRWPLRAKDPAATTLNVRRRRALEAVGRAGYGVDVVPQWDANIRAAQARYQRHLEESA